MNDYDLFASLADVNGEAGWCEKLFALSSKLGFDRLMFAIVPRPGMPLEAAFLRSTYDPGWRSTYDRLGMVHFDPTVGHCLTRTAPLFWSPELFASKAQKEMYEEASCYGLRMGVTLPIHGPGGEVGMVCFVTDGTPTRSLREDIAHALPELALLRDIAFETSRLFVDCHARAILPSLTVRERECLEWTAAGKSSWEIAQIFRCSEATVNFHMGNIRRKMGVSSRRAAAVKATHLGLIAPA